MSNITASFTQGNSSNALMILTYKYTHKHTCATNIDHNLFRLIVTCGGDSDAMQTQRVSLKTTGQSQGTYATPVAKPKSNPMPIARVHRNS